MDFHYFAREVVVETTIRIGFLLQKRQKMKQENRPRASSCFAIHRRKVFSIYREYLEKNHKGEGRLNILRLIIFYILLIFSLGLMFMNYLITGLVLLFITVIFIEPRNKKAPNPAVSMGKKEKLIRRFIGCIVLLITIYAGFATQALNLILPLLFISIMILPGGKI